MELPELKTDGNSSTAFLEGLNDKYRLVALAMQKGEEIEMINEIIRRCNRYPAMEKALKKIILEQTQRGGFTELWCCLNRIKEIADQALKE